MNINLLIFIVRHSKVSRLAFKGSARRRSVRGFSQLMEEV